MQALPRRHLQPVVQLGAPFFFVQQSVVSQVDRVHAGYDRHQAFEMVRWMPRSGCALRRVDGYSDQADCAPSRITGWPRLHDVPLHRPREEHDGPGRFLPGVSQAARVSRHAESGGTRAARFPDPAESRAAPPRVPQAVHAHADGGILLHLPQGASRRAGESLPLVPRLQRIRQLAGQRRLRARGTLVLLPAETAAVRRLPHAHGDLRRTQATSTGSYTHIASPVRTPRCPRRTKMLHN